MFLKTSNNISELDQSKNSMGQHQSRRRYNRKNTLAVQYSPGLSSNEQHLFWEAFKHSTGLVPEFVPTKPGALFEIVDFGFPLSMQEKHAIEKSMAEAQEIMDYGKAVHLSENDFYLQTKYIKFPMGFKGLSSALLQSESLIYALDLMSLDRDLTLKMTSNVFDHEAHIERLQESLSHLGVVPQVRHQIYLNALQDPINTSNSLINQQWNLELIQVEKAWKRLQDWVQDLGNPDHITGYSQWDDKDTTFGSQNIIVGIIDSGVESELGGSSETGRVPGLKGEVTGGVKKAIGFLRIQGNYHYDHRVVTGSHGTIVAGIATGKAITTNGGIYLGENVFGVAPNSPYAAVDYASVSLTRSILWLTKSGLFQPSTLLEIEKGVSVINMSISTKNPSREIFDDNPYDGGLELYDCTRFGRNGRGVVVVIAASNDGIEDILHQQLYSKFDETLVVGATSVKKQGSVFEEVKSSYSNTGERLDLTAPGGGSSEAISDYNDYMTFGPTPLEAGTFGGPPVLSTTISGAISQISQTGSKFTIGNVAGIYKGMNVSIGNSNHSDFEVRTIQNVDVNTNEVLCEPKFQFSATHGSNENIDIVGVSTELSADSDGTTIIKVKSLRGFSNYSDTLNQPSVPIPKQVLYIGPQSTGQQFIIQSIDYSSLEITVNIPVSGSLEDEIVIAGTLLSKVSKAAPSSKDSKTQITLRSTAGFFAGQKIEISGSTYSKRTKTIELIQGNTIAVSQLENLPPKDTLVMGLGGGNYITDFNGTSAATPVVSGVAALVMAANPYLSYLEVFDILKRSADKLQFRSMGIWKNERDWKDNKNNAGDAVFPFPFGFKAEAPNTILNQPAEANHDKIYVDDATGFLPDQVLKIATGSAKEFVVIWKVDNNNNIIQLKNRVEAPNGTHTIGTTITGGRIAHHSKSYGHGRVNALRAVEDAIDYKHSQRDLFIRDVFPFNPSNAPSNAASVDSPDIWVRNTHPDNDSSQFPTSAQSGADKHESPQFYKDRWIYVRVVNRGDTYSSLEGSNVMVSITTTKDTATTMKFPFPSMWHSGYSRENENIEVYNGDDYSTRMLTLVYTVRSVVYDENLLSSDTVGGPKNTRPERLPIIPPNGETIIKIPWPESIRPKDPTLERTFVKVQINPFDGPFFTEGTDKGNQVHLNGNLTFKEVFFECNCAVLNDINGSEYIAHEVPADGTSSTETVTVQFINTVDSADVNDLEIEVLRTKKDLTTETTTYKYTGSWGFTTAQSYAAFSGAPTTSGGTGLLTSVKFDGSFTLDNTDKSVKIFLKNSGITWDTQLIGVVTKFNYALDGIAQNKVAQIHTFTDFDLLPPQSGGNNYGSISDVKYRTSALFTGMLGGGPLPAYAVADGEVFITESGANQINLILKPTTQPSDRFAPVKYFVYRGLKRSSFLSGNQPASVGTSGLITEMHQAVADFNAAHAGVSGFVPATFKRNYLGLPELGDPAFPSKTTLEYMFDHPDHQFKKVNTGDHLGDFETTEEYGFQILVEAPNYRHTIGDVSVADHIITLTYSGGQPQFSTGLEEDISTKLYRERILGYVDPAAYYGNLFNEKITIHQGGGTSDITAEDIYDQVVSKFGTKDKIYVDIRNDYNNSLNFYGNFGSGSPANHAEIKFHNATNNWVIKDYHDGNGWPLLVLTQSDFPSNPSSQKEDLRIKLPEGPNSSPMIVLHGASYFGNFPSESARYRIRNTPASYTTGIRLGIPNNNIVGKVYPQTVRMSCHRRYDTNSLPPVVFPSNYIIKDDLIDTLMTFDDITLLPMAGHTNWKSLIDSRYVGWTSRNAERDFMIRTGMAKDDLGVVLMAIRTGEMEVEGLASNLGVHTAPNISVGRIRQVSFYNALMDPLRLSFINSGSIAVGGSNIPCLIVESKGDSYSDDILQQSTDDLMTVALDETEYSGIISQISGLFLGGSSKYLVAIDHEAHEDANGQPYYVFEIGVQGIEYDPGTFSHGINQVPTSVLVYSLDGRNYFTKNYSTAWISANQ